MTYKTKNNTKGIIFDLDGTLADTMPFHFRAWQLACNEYGMDMTSEFLKSQMGIPGWIISENIIEQYGMTGKVDPNELFAGKKNKYKLFRHKITAIKPVRDVVQEYYKKLIISVGTGAYREAAHRTLNHIGMFDYFDIIVCADDVSNHKPHPDTFLKCAELMNLKPSEIEVFEDGELGLEAARRAGMHPIDIRPWIEKW